MGHLGDPLGVTTSDEVDNLIHIRAAALNTRVPVLNGVGGF